MRTVTEREAAHLTGQLAHWAYNALDCCTTGGVLDALLPKLTPVTARTYAFERACQAPAMSMMRRGILVDEIALPRALRSVGRELVVNARAINEMEQVRKKWDGVELETGECRKSTRKDGRHKWPKGVADAERQCVDCAKPRVKRKPFNPGGYQQVMHLLYDLWGITPQKNKKREVSVDEECLEKVGRKWPEFHELTQAIVEYKGIQKQLGFLKSPLSPAGRMCHTASVGQAWTGRWSATQDAYRRGTNVQNIAEKNRHIFIADPGMKLGYFDLEQSDSRVVAYDAGDEAYIKAHETGNVHVMAARIFWPDLPWTGEAKEDKLFCKQTPVPWDPDHSYYDIAKNNQHALNFGSSPHGLAARTHEPLAGATKAYERYFTWAPKLKARQREIVAQVKETGVLTNPLGRRCQFFGRPDDPHTARQALSFIPQSMTADVLNLGLWLCWHDLDPELIHLLAQVHDAILFQFPEEREEEVRREMVMRMEIEVTMRDNRTMVIPVDPATGWNWGKRGPTNERGMG